MGHGTTNSDEKSASSATTSIIRTEHTDSKHLPPTASEQQLSDNIETYKANLRTFLQRFEHLESKEDKTKLLNKFKDDMISFAIAARLSFAADEELNAEQIKEATKFLNLMLDFFSFVDQATTSDELEHYITNLKRRFTLPDSTDEQTQAEYYNLFITSLNIYKEARYDLKSQTANFAYSVASIAVQGVGAVANVVSLGIASPISQPLIELIARTTNGAKKVHDFAQIDRENKKWWEILFASCTNPIRKIWNYAKKNPAKTTGIVLVGAAAITTACLFYPITLVMTAAAFLYAVASTVITIYEYVQAYRKRLANQKAFGEKLNQYFDTTVINRNRVNTMLSPGNGTCLAAQFPASESTATITNAMNAAEGNATSAKPLTAAPAPTQPQPLSSNAAAPMVNSLFPVASATACTDTTNQNKPSIATTP